MTKRIYSLTDGAITPKTATGNNVVSIPKTSVKYSHIASHEEKMTLYCQLFNNSKNYAIACTSIDNYIMESSQILAKIIIYSMYCTMFKKIDYENSTEEETVYTFIPGHNYDSAKQIVDSGYTDNMYFDIVGEISLYLCEHMEQINRGKMCIDWNINPLTWCFVDNCIMGYEYSISNDTFLAIYKVVRKYLYNNSQKQYNKECGVMMESYDNNGNYYEVNANINTKDYIAYTYNEIDKKYHDIIEPIINNIVCFIVGFYGKEYKVDTLRKVLYSMAKGETMKDNSYGISRNTYSKYKKAIINTFNCNEKFTKLYHNMVMDIDIDSIDNDYEIIHDYIVPTGIYLQFTDDNYCKNSIMDGLKMDDLSIKKRGKNAINYNNKNICYCVEKAMHKDGYYC